MLIDHVTYNCAMFCGIPGLWI